MAKKYHPDVNQSNADKFKLISAAYEVLGDKDKKSKYDEIRAARRDIGQADQTRTYSHDRSSGTFT